MASTSSEPIQQYQQTFLISDRITPTLITSHLSHILSSSSPPLHSQSHSIWVATAVLYTLCDAEQASKLSNIDAVRELIEVGLKAASGPPDSTGSTPESEQSIKKQLHERLLGFRDALQAFDKTGVRVDDAEQMLKQEGAAVDDAEDDDDEESPWFDTKAATPSPSPAPEPSPHVPLASLVGALSSPVQLAKLLAPMPERLTVWLNSISKQVFSEQIWPARFDVVRVALAHAAITGDRSLVQQLAKANILPSPTGNDIWAQLKSSTYNDSQDVINFYLTEARTLEDVYGDAATALQLTQHALQSSTDTSSKTIHDLQQLSSQLRTFLQYATQSSSASSSMSSTDFHRRLAAQPVDVIVEMLNSDDNAQRDTQAIVNLIKSISQGQKDLSPSDLMRDVCFIFYSRKAVLSPALLQVLLAVSNSAADILISLLLSLPSIKAAKGLTDALKEVVQPQSTSAGSHLPASLLRSFPRLSAVRQENDLTRALAVAPPSAKSIQHQLSSDDSITDDQRAALQSRCAVFAQEILHDDTHDALSSSMATLPPWSIILCQGQRNVQETLLKHILKRAVASCATAADCEALKVTINTTLVTTALFDAVDDSLITRDLLSVLLLQERFDVFPDIAAHVPSSTAQQVIITSARHHFDRASGGRGGLADLKKARSSLALAASSPLIEQSTAFLSAVIRLMQLTPTLASSLHPSVPLTPLEVRLAQDKLSIIRSWLGRGEDGAWKRGDDVLQTAIALVEGSTHGALGEPDHDDDEGAAATTSSSSSSSSVATPSKKLIQVQVYAILSDAALSHDDLELTAQYIESLLQSFRDLSRKTARASSSSSSTSSQRTLSTARETLWLTLFSASKHPNASSDARLTSYWLAEALAHAPIERSAELLKRWRSVVASADSEQEEQELAFLKRGGAAAGVEAANGRMSSSSPLPSLLRLPTGAGAAAVNVASGLGAGVFGLAAEAMNSSHWRPLSRGGGGAAAAAAGETQQHHPSATAAAAATTASPPAVADGWGPASGLGLGTALSSLAGSFTEGYSGRFTGFLGGAAGAVDDHPSVRVTTAPSDAHSQAPGTSTSTSTTAPQPSPPQRTAASLFDSLGGGGNDHHRHQQSTGSGAGRSESPYYLDPAERAARAARGFLSGLRGSSGSRHEESPQRVSSSSSNSNSTTGGWAARGMDWLLDEESRQQSSR